MDRFENVRSYLNSVNRSVLLAIGLVLIAGLIAVVFVYGDTGEDEANGTTETEEVVVNNDDEARDGEVDREDEARDEDEEAVASATDERDSGAALPSELADTGPATPFLALTLMGGAAYLYRRSSNQVIEEQTRA